MTIISSVLTTAGFRLPELILGAFSLVLLVGLLLILRSVMDSLRKVADIPRRIEESDQLSAQAIQLVSTQLNERIAEQTRAINHQQAEQTKALNERLTEQARLSNENQTEQTQAVNTELSRNREEMSKEFRQVRETMESRLKDMQQENTKKLDEMRATVDEKLSATLEKRFSESFTLINERLESVQRGLGEMQILAGNVTDLKNILANVKTRGNFGEYQLQALLEDVFTADQYEINFAPNPRSQHRVEFAIKMPGNSSNSEPVFLPIDSKFPIEDYQRLLDAYDGSDKEAIANQHKQLVNQSKIFARDIRDKYLNPPKTTDFGIMFVPTEGLYAELIREPGFANLLYRDYKVLLAGPSVLQAMLVSYQIGFSTLAIEKRSSEIEQLLGAVKTEFDKFEGILENVDKRLEQARNEIGKATQKSGTIRRKLKSVTELPVTESELLLQSTDSVDAEVADIEDIYG